MSSVNLGVMRAMGQIMERAAFALKAGITFGGKRDLYSALGYKRELQPLDFRGRYERGGIAARIVEAYPNACWRGKGNLIENEDPEIETEFETEWDVLNKRLNVWAQLQRLDTLAGIGQYAVLLIGAEGDITQEMPKLKSQEDILFLAPYAQDEATIVTVESDTENERFGLPTAYRIRRRIQSFSGGRVAPNFDKTVHWTRVIHFANLSLDDRVYGHSILERVWNDLDNLDKVVGGGSEAYWLRVHKGLFFNVDPTTNVTDDKLKEMKDAAEEFANGMRRTMAMRGAALQDLGSDVANFNAPVTSIISLLSGATGIPQRLMLGSERGELASSQDRENWSDRVQDRRDDTTVPMIVRPFVERLIDYGALPEPEDWHPEWPNIDELTEPEKATIAGQWAGLNGTAKGVVVLPEEIRDKVLGLEKLTPKQIADATPEPPAPPQQLDANGDPIPPDPNAEPKDKNTPDKKGVIPPQLKAARRHLPKG